MNRIITDQQLQEVTSVLAEIPAKHSFNAILTLQNLPQEEVTQATDD